MHRVGRKPPWSTEGGGSRRNKSGGDKYGSSASVTIGEGDQNADSALIGDCRAVHIARDHAILDAQRGAAPEMNVLTDGRHQLGLAVGHRTAAAGISHGFQRVEIATAVEGQAGHGADEVLETLVAGDEIGFGVDFDQGAGLAADGDVTDNVTC